MNCSSILFTRHAVQRMFERKLSRDGVKSIVLEGEIIQSYPNDKPFPSYLILGYHNRNALHVVVGKNEESSECIVVTVYRPNTEKWSDDFKRRQ